MALTNIRVYNTSRSGPSEGFVVGQTCVQDPVTAVYHYYGIAVKESSQYYDVMYSKKGAAWVSETGKKEVSKQTVAYSPRSKLGTLLPEFPNVKDLNLPASLPEEKVSTFIMMYRTHCQRILDTVIRANFDEVQSFLLHFWQGMPPHMLPVLGSSTVVNIVGVCDSILYKAISGVLMPTVLQALPDSLTQVIRKFAKQLDEWLKVALHDLPENLRNIKFERRLGVHLENGQGVETHTTPNDCKNEDPRQAQGVSASGFTDQDHFTSSAHCVTIGNRAIRTRNGVQKVFPNSETANITKSSLSDSFENMQASRTVIHSTDITFQMLEDWRNVDLNSITKQTLYTMEDSHEEHRKLIIQLYQEFDHLLEEQSPIESYIEWLDTMVDRCVVKVAAKRQGSLRKVAQQFLLMWSCFGTRVIRDMTLHSAPSFGSFHLIHLMFDDYVLYLLESLHCQERANELMRAMKGEGSTAEVQEEIILTDAAPPTPSPVPSFSPAKSATSVEVPPPSSPVSNPSPEYTGLSTTGNKRSPKALSGELTFKARTFWINIHLSSPTPQHGQKPEYFPGFLDDLQLFICTYSLGFCFQGRGDSGQRYQGKPHKGGGFGRELDFDKGLQKGFLGRGQCENTHRVGKCGPFQRLRSVHDICALGQGESLSADCTLLQSGTPRAVRHSLRAPKRVQARLRYAPPPESTNVVYRDSTIIIMTRECVYVCLHIIPRGCNQMR
ncbi:hypothetical protein QTO34_017948 [Cnephaeus nilssonii]|uniref:RFX1-4/6/8-like BCD domain-containing protein n=1 Tax=Cnephaeus nilssonii TaxID=3371016 RepID=A0AA40LRQ7_CNENI|nr:hypothetical protein QTO34_017948 [Eptesicus nilssonii]